MDKVGNFTLQVSKDGVAERFRNTIRVTGSILSDGSVHVHFKREEAGTATGLTPVDRTFELTQDAWQQDIRQLLASTALTQPVEAHVGVGVHVALAAPGAPAEAVAGAPDLPSNRDDWVELGEALAALADDAPVAVRFLKVTDKGAVHGLFVEHDSRERTARLAYYNEQGLVHTTPLSLLQYKEVRGAVRWLMPAGQAVNVQRDRKPGLYLQGLDGYLYPWDRFSEAPSGETVEAIMRRAEDVLGERVKVSFFPRS